jgi:hypothetical protein
MMRAWDADAGGQAAALESAQTDAGAPASPPAQTDAPKPPEADWKAQVSALGVDPAWVRNANEKLVKTGKIKLDDIQADALADPEHRKWLNRMLRKNADEEAAAASAAATQGAAAQTAPRSAPAAGGGANSQQVATMATSSKPAPSVLKPGHMPTGQLWQGTATPGGGGWSPAGNGLWWPPWPVTGGPIQKPAVQSATQQANALDTTTGQARPDLRG